MMFLNTVLPAMFPFYVLSALVVSSGLLARLCAPLRKFTYRVLKLPPTSIVAVLLGCLCGFPIGAKITADLLQRGDITADEAARLSSFTNNVGPIFMASVVGTAYLGSLKTGLLLWCCITLSSWLCGILLCRFRKAAVRSAELPLVSTVASSKIDIPGAILSSLNTILYVGAVIIFFSSVTALLQRIPGISNLTYGLSYSFLEITGGLNILAAKFHPQTLLVKYMVISSVCAWSGCSVHLQVCGILASNQINVKYYFIGKILQAAIAPLLCYLTFGIIVL